MTAVTAQPTKTPTSRCWPRLQVASTLLPGLDLSEPAGGSGSDQDGSAALTSAAVHPQSADPGARPHNQAPYGETAASGDAGGQQDAAADGTALLRLAAQEVESAIQNLRSLATAETAAPPSDNAQPAPAGTTGTQRDDDEQRLGMLVTAAASAASRAVANALQQRPAGGSPGRSSRNVLQLRPSRAAPSKGRAPPGSHAPAFDDAPTPSGAAAEDPSELAEPAALAAGPRPTVSFPAAAVAPPKQQAAAAAGTAGQPPPQPSMRDTGVQAEQLPAQLPAHAEPPARPVPGVPPPPPPPQVSEPLPLPEELAASVQRTLLYVADPDGAAARHTPALQAAEGPVKRFALTEAAARWVPIPRGSALVARTQGWA